MGVDKMDQLMGSYSISRKTSRWYNRLIFWMLDAILVCMYICCRAVPALQGKYIKDNSAFGANYEFRVALAQELVKEARRLTPNPDDRFWEPLRQHRTAGGQFSGERKSFHKHEVFDVPPSSQCSVCYARTNPKLLQANRKNECAYTTRWCVVCQKRICVDCNYHWDHDNMVDNRPLPSFSTKKKK